MFYERPKNPELLCYNEFFDNWGNTYPPERRSNNPVKDYRYYLKENGEELRAIEKIYRNNEDYEEHYRSSQHQKVKNTWRRYISETEMEYMSFDEMREVGRMRELNLED